MKYYITKNKIESNRCLELFDSKETLYTIGSGDTLFCVTSNKVFFDKIKSFLESEKNDLLNDFNQIGLEKLKKEET